MKMTSDGRIRRYCQDQQTSAERAIQTAVDEVEKIGANPVLTEIVSILGNAKGKLSDFIER